MLAGISLVVVAVVCGVWSLTRGQDVNFDQRNYHLYDVWAVLHGRLDVDFAPAGIHTYIPQYHNIPFFFMSRDLPPELTGFLMGAMQGIAVWLAAAVAWRLLPGWPTALRLAMATAITVVGTWSPGVITNIGTTFGDVITAVPVLVALLILVAS